MGAGSGLYRLLAHALPAKGQLGLVTSNRRISNDQLDQIFGESFQDLARTAIENQDNEIAQRSGKRRAKIKSIVRA